MSSQQLPLDLIHHESDGSVIDQRTGDGYINATALCKASGKLWGDYRRNANTVAFLAELEADMGYPISDLVHSIKGRAFTAGNMGASSSSSQLGGLAVA
jgi:hypothetical protein